MLRLIVKDFGDLQTDQYLRDLEESLQLLANNPDLGRSCDNLRKGYQRHEYQSHIIFYRPASIYVKPAACARLRVGSITIHDIWQPCALLH